MNGRGIRTVFGQSVADLNGRSVGTLNKLFEAGRDGRRCRHSAFEIDDYRRIDSWSRWMADPAVESQYEDLK